MSSASPGVIEDVRLKKTTDPETWTDYPLIRAQGQSIGQEQRFSPAAVLQTPSPQGAHTRESTAVTVHDPSGATMEVSIGRMPGQQSAHVALVPKGSPALLQWPTAPP